jgi:hypothetical protein
MSIFKRIGLLIARIHPAVNKFLKQFEDATIQKCLDLAIHVTTSLKVFLNYDAVIRVVEFTQTDVDNQLRTLMLEAIDENVTHLMGAKMCRDLPTPDARLQCYREHLRAMSEEEVNDQLRRLGAAVAASLAAKMGKIITSRNFWNLGIELYLWIKKNV